MRCIALNKGTSYRGGHIIILRTLEGGVRANLDAAGGATYLIFPLVKLILGPPFGNYCTVPNISQEFRLSLSDA